MARRRTARSARLAGILLWAGTVSGAILTLSNFQTISSVSRSCRVAYDTPIPGCRLRDFTDKSCSFECEHSLAGAQSNIQASCGLVDVGPDTLLHQAQRGILVGALCGSGNDGRTTTATRTPPSPPQTTLRSSTRIPPAPTTSSATTTSTTSTTGTTSVSQPAETSEPTTSSATSTAQPSSTSQDVTAAPPQPSTSDESTSSRTWSTTTAQPRQTLIPGSGGGTPFDFVAAGTPTRPMDTCAMLSVVACAVGLLLAQ